MARITPSPADAEDFLYVTRADRTLALPTGATTLTWWTAETGGTQHAGLLLNGQAVNSIPVTASGRIPRHEWPDGVTEAWADAGAGRTLYRRTGSVGAATDRLAKDQNLADLPDKSVARSNLGLANKWDFYGNSAGLTVGPSGTYLIQSPATLASATLWCDSAPVGSDLVVQLQRSANAGSTWTTLATLTVPAGSTTEVGATVTTALAANDRIRLNATSVGSTTAAKGGGFLVNAA